MIMCYRCYTPQTRDQLKPSGKVKGLSLESSKSIKRCKNCKCKVFFTIEETNLT